jgi:hypothetical protein
VIDALIDLDHSTRSDRQLQGADAERTVAWSSRISAGSADQPADRPLFARVMNYRTKELNHGNLEKGETR